MAADGAPNTTRVTDLGLPKIYAKVVDQVLNSPTLISRFMGSAEPFEGFAQYVVYDVTADSQGQWFTGLETLNTAATSTTVTGSYNHTAFTQPQVSIMLESFANAGSLGVINVDDFKFQKAAAQALQALGSSIYSDGSGNQLLGLDKIVDDSGTIGNLARSTYSSLNATDTASGGTLTLAKMATLHDAVSAAGISTEEPNIGVTTKTVWSLYEQLLTPQVRADYNSVGYPSLAVRGKYMMKNKSDLKAAAGFNALSFRGMPIIKDDFCTSGYLFFLNENYLVFKGRTLVPDMYKQNVRKVNLGTMSAYEGTGAAALDLPSEFNGWFYQDPLTIPDQAGKIARFYVFGQMIPLSFRRQGRLTGITTV